MIARKMSRVCFNLLLPFNIKFLAPLRAFFLKCAGAATGKRLKINSFVVVDYPESIFFGDDVSVNQFTKISAIGTLKIGDCVSIANGVSILSAKHPASRGFKFDHLITRQVDIGSNVWIGTNSVVMANITDNCIIGANSYVPEDLHEPGVYVGNPVRKVRSL